MESIHALYVSVLLCALLLGSLPPTGAEESDAAGRREEREKRSLPYWGLWSSDFFGWLEELRAQAAHEGMEDLARTFWAHFPIGSNLGYDSPESDPQPESSQAQEFLARLSRTKRNIWDCSRPDVQQLRN